MRRDKKILNLADMQRLARRRLPRAILDVIDGGAGDEETVLANQMDWQSLNLISKHLEDVTTVDLTTTVLGKKFDLPFMFAPCSYARMCDPSGERAVARGAGRRGVGYVVPGGASEPLEEIAAEASGPLWYQIYMGMDPGRTASVVDRAQASGYEALVVSVDTPTNPYRERDLRNEIALPMTVSPQLIRAGLSRPNWSRKFVMGDRSSGYSFTASHRAYESFKSTMSGLRPVSLDDIAWLRARWQGPLVVKGLLGPDKLRELEGIGVDAVVVSNHGGRNLDGVVSSARALPRVVEAAGSLEVFVDGGIRKGTDIVRMRALGATACLVGRPYLHGLAANGAAGVERVAELLENELSRALAFLGIASFDEISADVLSSTDAL